MKTNIFVTQILISTVYRNKNLNNFQIHDQCFKRIYFLG